ncbi:unnamed protein product [Echinostoma caproni]|uniref:Uncharacterized protein n=1 Tax=Echinostoma caproni TaxID=27848 RepID=A0A183B8U5_9TREM|nr:unnamed protein product [Echinostoma caproni]
MDVRAELLYYLFHPDGKGRTTSASTVGTSSDKPVSRIHSTSSFVQLTADVSRHKHSFTEEPDSSDAIPLFSLTAGIVQRPLLTEEISTTTVFQSPILRVKDLNRSIHATTGAVNELSDDWHSLVAGLDTVERSNLAQTLINELKRWIYGFVTDWNSRCVEFESLAKRAEKSAKETRKKTLPPGPIGMISALKTDTASPLLPSPLVADVDSSPPITALRTRQIADSGTRASSTSLADNFVSDIHHESSTQNVTGSVVSSVNETPAQRQSKLDLLEKKQRLPVLDPLHLKGKSVIENLPRGRWSFILTTERTCFR